MAATNPHMAAARARKVAAVVSVLDEALADTPNPTDRLLAVAGLSDDAWRMAAITAGTRPLSPESRAAVCLVYAERAAKGAA